LTQQSRLQPFSRIIQFGPHGAVGGGRRHPNVLYAVLRRLSIENPPLRQIGPTSIAKPGIFPVDV
jgi:hypothetical protein